MVNSVAIIGAGLAGSEAALTLSHLGIGVDLYEMRPEKPTAVHKTPLCAELVCSNSLKSMKPESAAGMLKHELDVLGSTLYKIALDHRVPAGGALAVDRDAFAKAVTEAIENDSNLRLCRQEVVDLTILADSYEAVMVASGPLTSDNLAESLRGLIGQDYLAFFDAAAPIVMADSLDFHKLFRQSRYEEGSDNQGDYLNAPLDQETYESFIDELLGAQRTILHDFETKDLFSACQPIEEIAKAGRDAPRFGPLKPVGLKDPATGKRPWAALQLRAENLERTAYNLVGFQTNLTFPEQKRVFSLIPGLENAEFARYGVMHRNTFINAPTLLNHDLSLAVPKTKTLKAPIYVIGQLAGTEGYGEAIRSGLHGALAVAARIKDLKLPPLPQETAFGALLAYATNPNTKDYQPMHVNFGIMKPLDPPVKSKGDRYRAYGDRGALAIYAYAKELQTLGLLKESL